MASVCIRNQSCLINGAGPEHLLLVQLDLSTPSILCNKMFLRLNPGLVILRRIGRLAIFMLMPVYILTASFKAVAVVGYIL